MKSADVQDPVDVGGLAVDGERASDRGRGQERRRLQGAPAETGNQIDNHMTNETGETGTALA